MSRAWLAALAVGAMAFLGLARPASAQGDPASQIFQLVNQVRAENGLAGFAYHGSLAAAAQSHANWMAQTVTYSHTGANGSTPYSRAAAAGYVGIVSENIVGGTGMTPSQGIAWWRNSSIHFSTMVSTRYSQAGTGFASNGSQNFYVLLVGQPSNAPAAPAPPQPVAAPRPTAAPTVDNSVEESAAPIYVEPIVLAPPRPDGSIVHVMGEGQALWTVAAYYDVPLAQLYLNNGLGPADVVHPGNEIVVKLAEGQVPPPTPTPALSHTVRAGESLWSIVDRYGLNFNELLAYNGLQADSTIYAGMQLIIRLAPGQAAPPTPTPPQTYIVQPGDSLYAIAEKHGLPIEQLLALNNLTIDAVLAPGTELRVAALLAAARPAADPKQLPLPNMFGEPVVPIRYAPPTPQTTALLAGLPRPAPAPSATPARAVAAAAGSAEGSGGLTGASLTAVVLVVILAAAGVLVKQRSAGP
ncbi:MAG: LysM peptidoglycan-binding domain-containing protein [Candidatus Promineifilaceae bacterium]